MYIFISDFICLISAYNRSQYVFKWDDIKKYRDVFIGGWLIIIFYHYHQALHGLTIYFHFLISRLLASYRISVSFRNLEELNGSFILKYNLTDLLHN